MSKTKKTQKRELNFGNTDFTDVLASLETLTEVSKQTHLHSAQLCDVAIAELIEIVRAWHAHSWEFDEGEQ